MSAVADNWTGTGYDAEASQSSGGLHLRLKTKGQQARLRLVSEAYRYIDTLPDGKQIRKASWTAILKEVVDGKPVKRVVVFHGGPMIYGLVKDLTHSPDWGDPATFDVTVTRTEEEGKYYTVMPHPKPLGPITEDEAALVADAAVDLVMACTQKRPKASTGDEPDPFEEG